MVAFKRIHSVDTQYYLFARKRLPTTASAISSAFNLEHFDWRCTFVAISSRICCSWSLVYDNGSVTCLSFSFLVRFVLNILLISPLVFSGIKSSVRDWIIPFAMARTIGEIKMAAAVSTPKPSISSLPCGSPSGLLGFLKYVSQVIEKRGNSWGAI